MSCPPPEAIVDFSSGLLGRAAGKALETHLSGCTLCKREVELLERLSSGRTPISRRGRTAPTDEKLLVERMKKEGGLRKTRKKTRGGDEIQFLNRVEKGGDAWIPAAPTFAQEYRGMAFGTHGEAGALFVAAVAGVIMDRQGRRASFRAVRLQDKKRQRPMPLLTRTDDAGRFRFGRVEPGEYLLKAGKIVKEIVVVDPRAEAEL